MACTWLVVTGYDEDKGSLAVPDAGYRWLYLGPDNSRLDYSISVSCDGGTAIATIEGGFLQSGRFWPSYYGPSKLSITLDFECKQKDGSACAPVWIDTMVTHEEIQTGCAVSIQPTVTIDDDCYVVVFTFEVAAAVGISQSYGITGQLELGGKHGGNTLIGGTYGTTIAATNTARWGESLKVKACCLTEWEVQNVGSGGQSGETPH